MITEDVPADALAVERGQQTNREGGASRFREIRTRGKKPKQDDDEAGPRGSSLKS